MSRTDPQFKLRMSPELRAQVEQAAKAANRSLNAELVTRLQASFKSAPKAPVEVPADAPAQVPAQAAPTGLRLLCLLDPSNGRGHTGPRYLPVHTMYPVPPRSMVRGKWSEPRYAGLYLRETHAKRPTAEVLARMLKHRKTNALRADSRAVRTGELSHG